MEIKNVALSVVQGGLTAAAGVVIFPGLVVVGAVSSVAYAAKKVEEVGVSALEEVYYGAGKLYKELEGMKTKSKTVDLNTVCSTEVMH